MPSTNQVLKQLKAKARPDRLEGMARYGLSIERRLGLSIPAIRQIAQETGRDHQLALELWKTGIADAMIAASLVAQPEELTEAQMEEWVKDFDSWDVCDQVCQNLFDKTPLAWKKVRDWSEREEEFVKRAAYALIACLALHDKKAVDEDFVRLFPVIERGATDERNYVKKAVNWALRNVGKRNLALNQAALAFAREIQRMDSKTARWIAADAIRDMESEPAQRRVRKRT